MRRGLVIECKHQLNVVEVQRHRGSHPFMLRKWMGANCISELNSECLGYRVRIITNSVLEAEINVVVERSSKLYLDATGRQAEVYQL